MFDLENAITNWRRQMEAAGMETPAALEELEAHLRESIERQVRSGISEASAFETAVAEMGQPQTLHKEFRKNGTTRRRKVAIFAVAAGLVMIGRVLMVRAEAASPLWKQDQLGWILFSSIAILWGVSVLFFHVNFGLGSVREVRLWKLTGFTYSVIAIWLSFLPILQIYTQHAPHLVEVALGLSATAATVLSVFGWGYFRSVLPVIRSRWIRTLIGIGGCLLGPALLALFFCTMSPRWAHFPTQLFFALLAWGWALMAILAGVGYGLAEAARGREEGLTA